MERLSEKSVTTSTSIIERGSRTREPSPTLRQENIDSPYAPEAISNFSWVGGGSVHDGGRAPKKRRPIPDWTSEHQSHGKAKEERVCIYCGEPIGAFQWYIRRVYSVAIRIMSRITGRKVQGSILEVEYEHINCPRDTD